MKRLSEYSQNFLRSPQLVAELIKQSNLKADDIIYDIGAGSGVISSEVAKKVKKVVAIEFDQRVAASLKQNMAKYPNVEVRIGDFMEMPLPKEPYKVFANIPFHLSSPIIQRFINTPFAPEAAYLIVQKQFGRKLVATDTTHFTSQLGMVVGAEYVVKVIKNLRRTDFWPAPAVDTVCIEMVKRKAPLVAPNRLIGYRHFTEACFSDPKKLAKMPLEVIGATAGISPSRLSLTQWILLFNSQTMY